MANVLGLSFYYHDSAAALVCDGQIVAAAAEERFCRQKHTNEFPRQSIEYCLEVGGFSSINDIDAIIFYEKPTIKLQRIVESLVAVWPRGLSTFAQELPDYLSSKHNIYRIIEKTLPGFKNRILFADHHRSHAASAFYCSPYENAAILTMDGIGEWESTTIGMGRGRDITLDRAIHYPHSIGLLYSALTGYLGFHVNDGEWKVMGLAPYGQPTYVEQFRKLVEMKEDGSFRLNMHYFVHHLYGDSMAHYDRWNDLFGVKHLEGDSELTQAHKDLARSGQAVVEELIVNLAREARRASDCENLVIAGGVGLNSVANWKIEQEGIFENIWIQPAPGDDGGALGAALLASQELFNDARTSPMTHAYWGPEYTQEEIESFLENNDFAYETLNDEDLIEQTAKLIGEGKVIGWFQGRMEFGPRALGARSILADATNPNMKATINSKIKYREDFRPFAPAVPLEHVHEYFDVAPGTELPFMLKVPKVLEEKKSVIPAVTHEDGTGRVQTVTEDSNPLYHKLLLAIEKRTGVPIVINTSFNVRGEPIVCTPKDAMTCFLNSGIDVLVLGNCLITEKMIDATGDQAGYDHSDHLEKEIAETNSGNVVPLIAQRFSMKAVNEIVPTAPATLAEAPAIEDAAETQRKVLKFYKELPFNCYSNGVEIATQLQRDNRIKEYAPVHQHLKTLKNARLIDVGCGAGWFVNSSAHYYDLTGTGLDLNPVVLKQARSAARFMPGCENNTYVETSVFDYEPNKPFDVVNSLGVLHSTPDCHGAIRKVLDWVAPNGYLHLGLYHLYGRRPFLQYFADMQTAGASDEEMYDAYKVLSPDISDETHMLSWFRDQVLHPHETQHTHEEIDELLRSEGFVIESTSINNFKPISSLAEIVAMEKQCEDISKEAIYRKKRYYPGFFSVWARRTS